MTTGNLTVTNTQNRRWSTGFLTLRERLLLGVGSFRVLNDTRRVRRTVNYYHTNIARQTNVSQTMSHQTGHLCTATLRRLTTNRPQVLTTRRGLTGTHMHSRHHLLVRRRSVRNTQRAGRRTSPLLRSRSNSFTRIVIVQNARQGLHYTGLLRGTQGAKGATVRATTRRRIRSPIIH